MTSKEIVEQAMQEQGRMMAESFRAEAVEQGYDGTKLIANEAVIPAWGAQTDYSGAAAGTPVRDEGQVWTLLQPHNAANYAGRPSTLRALWGLCHTKDPEQAKPWVEPYGTSGMYQMDECYQDGDGTVWQCRTNNVVYDADTMPEWWSEVTQDG